MGDGDVAGATTTANVAVPGEWEALPSVLHPLPRNACADFGCDPRTGFPCRSGDRGQSAEGRFENPHVSGEGPLRRL